MSVFDKFKDTFKKTKDIVEDKLEDASEMMSKKMEEMQPMLNDAKEKATKAAGNIKEVVSDKMEDMQPMINDAKEKASKAFDSAKNKAEDFYGKEKPETHTNKAADVPVDMDDDTLDLIPLEDSTDTATPPKSAEELGLSSAKDGLFKLGDEETVPTTEPTVKDHATTLRESSGDALDRTVEAAKEMGDMIQEKADKLNQANEDKVADINDTFDKMEAQNPLDTSTAGIKDHAKALGESAGDALDRTVEAAKKMGDMIQEKADNLNKVADEQVDDVIEDIKVVEEDEKKEDGDKKDPSKKSYSDLVDDAKDALFGF